jgi:hypothetical protein
MRLPAYVSARLTATRSELLRGCALATIHRSHDLQEEAAAVRASCVQARRFSAQRSLTRQWRPTAPR